VGFNFRRRYRHCNFLKRGNGDNEREISKCQANPRQIIFLIRSQEASMGKLTLAEKVRERSRGKKLQVRPRAFIIYGYGIY
jgi:hypothetical protein